MYPKFVWVKKYNTHLWLLPHPYHVRALRSREERISITYAKGNNCLRSWKGEHFAYWAQEFIEYKKQTNWMLEVFVKLRFPPQPSPTQLSGPPIIVVSVLRLLKSCSQWSILNYKVLIILLVDKLNKIIITHFWYNFLMKGTIQSWISPQANQALPVF